MLYQLHVHNYTPDGTLAATQRELPRLARSGVGIVWLMPLHPRGRMKPTDAWLAQNDKASPVPVPPEHRDEAFVGNPYCPRDHMEIDPQLGTFADLKSFTDAAHALEMKVIVGWVPNHSSWDAPILAQHPDWYLHDERGRVQYHAPWQPIARLTYAERNSELWDYMLEARRKFVEQGGVDGFREDVADATPLEHWQWLRPRLDPDHQLLMLAEAGEPKLLGPFDMIYDWQMPTVLWSILDGDATTDAIDELLKTQAEAQPSGARMLRFAFNHDQNGAQRSSWQGRFVVEKLYGAQNGPAVPTNAQKYGVALCAAMLLYATLPGGHPLIFQGQEVGFVGNISNGVGESEPVTTRRPHPEQREFYAQTAALHARVDGADFRRLSAGANPKVYAFERQLEGDERALIVVNLDKKNAAQVQLAPGQTRALRDVSPPFSNRAKNDAVADEFELPPGGFRALTSAK